MTKEQMMKYVPKSKREAIKDAWTDSDGYWMTINDGWETIDGCHVIHEYRIIELRQCIREIRRER